MVLGFPNYTNAIATEDTFWMIAFIPSGKWHAV